VSVPLIISASGIRGVFGVGLTPEIAARYGAAFGSYLRDKTGSETGIHVVVGRDSRTSGELLVDAVCAGLRATGHDVRDLGIVPTPTGLLAVGDSPDAVGGVLVTASHNPAVWNGLKLASREGRFLRPEDGLEVQRIFEEGPVYSDWSGVGSRSKVDGATDHHLDRILALDAIDRDSIAARGFKVVLDCVRGAGGHIMSDLLDRLGCHVVGIDLEPDGCFPRNPEPTPENLVGLGRRVVEEGADIGLAVDPDVDRLALVDETGSPVGEDWTLALAVELVASREAGAVVTNLSSSLSIQEAAERAGSPFYRTPVGEANVVSRMLEESAVIGGEGNGGVIYPALHLTRDAPLATALILQWLAEETGSLRTRIAQHPRYWIAKRKIDRGSFEVAPLLVRVREAVPPEATVDATDGLRVEWPDGRWVHVRPSGTEPILRIVAEAPQERGAIELVDWVEGRIHTGT
jgi:phosphomannomutase